MHSDELAKRIQNGDQSALNEAIKANYNDIYHFLCRKLADKNAAQDVAQTVFLKFIGGIHSYHEHGKLKNYLFKLAQNAGNDYFRSKAPESSPIEDCEGLASSLPMPHEIAEKNEAAYAVQNALQALPDYQRDTIILRFYHELAFKDIARVMGCKEPTAKSRYKQGMDKLKTLLEKANDNE